MKRKVLSTIVALLLAVALLPMSVLAASYTDTDGHWAEKSIERWSDAGIVQGTGDVFSPDGDLTCAHLATILAKLLRLPAADDAGFTDNVPDAWYYDAINRCAAADILTGYADGTVRPNESISRARAMVMLARALGIETAGTSVLNGYADSASVPDWARGYVAALLRADIVAGVSGSRLAPLANITRAQFVTILDRAIAIYADEDGATVKADDVDGLIVVVAEDVTIKDAPAGTKVVATAKAKGLKVNGKSADANNIHVVPETVERPKSAGHAHTHEYTIFETDWNTMETVKKCACGASETVKDSDTYYIADTDDLKAFRDKVNNGSDFAGKTIRLTANIDLENEEWTPIGTKEHPFSGTFDGSRKTISNLKITSGSYVGLFGYVGSAVIENIDLVGASVSGADRVGGLIGKITGNATVRNCSLDETSQVSGSGSNTGGLIGEAVNGSEIALTGLTNRASVTNTASANARAGGIIGQVTTNAIVTITNCRNEGAVTAENGYTGGIVSAYQNGSLTIDSCANSGTLTGAYTGDLVAWFTSVRTLSISGYDDEAAKAIGLLSDDYSRNITINGDTYFVNKTAAPLAFAEALNDKQELSADVIAQMDAVIDFFNYGRQHNPNFVKDDYPQTRWELFDRRTGFGGDGWPQLLAQYNEEFGKSLTQDDFSFDFSTHTTYFISAQN